MIIIFSYDNQDTWFYFIVDYSNSRTGDVINTGIPKTWSYLDYSLVQNKGYFISFNGDGTYKGLFIDCSGKVVSSFETSLFTKWEIDGHAVVIQDPDGDPNGFPRLFYFDGSNVSTYDLPNATNVEVGNDISSWDRGTKFGSTPVKVSYDTYAEWYLMNINGLKLVYTDIENPGIYSVSLEVQSLTDFAVLVLNGVGLSPSCYSSVQFFNTEGEKISDLDLSSDFYDYLYYGSPTFYGQNSVQLAFWVDGDLDYNYLFVNFDGKDLTSYSVERGTSFSDLQVEWSKAGVIDDYDYNPGSILNMMYSPLNDSPLDQNSENLKLVYKFESDTYYQEYNFTNRTAWYYGLNCTDKSIILRYSDAGVGSDYINMSVISLLPGEQNPQQVLVVPRTYYGYSFGTFGDYYFVYFNFNDDGIYTSLIIYNYDLSLNWSTEFGGEVNNYRFRNGCLYIRDWNNNTCFYFNSSSDGIQELDIFYSQRGWDSLSEFESGINDGNMVLFNPPYYTGPSFRILGSSSITEDIILEYGDEWNYNITKDYFYWYYFDGFWKFRIYDMSGNLVNKFDSSFDTLFGADCIGKRVGDGVSENGSFKFLHLFKDGYSIFDTTGTSDISTIINDYRWYIEN